MIIDITQDIFTCKVFPGDPAPHAELVKSFGAGDVCNLTEFSMCAHNGTHVDAPLHFIDGGKSIGEVGLEPFVGSCYVAHHDGDILAPDAERMLAAARAADAGERILVEGAAALTPEGAEVFASAGIKLYGNESQTVGLGETQEPVHHILLGAGLVLLEGAVLHGIAEGKYFLSAAPIFLGRCEGAPCRAYLIK